MRVEFRGKAFGPRAVLGPVSLTLAAGERLAILGPSGIGKSTLLRIVTGLSDADGLVRDADARLGVVFQEPTLLPWRDALANVMLPTRCDAGSALARMAEVGLAGAEALFPRQMSLGQQRRLALARALAAGPQVLVMDEPFASLDLGTRDRMLTLTAALLDAHGAGLLLVTHDPAEADGLRACKLWLGGAPATLSDRPPA